MYRQVCKHNVSRMQNLVHVHVYLYKITHVCLKQRNNKIIHIIF